MPCSICLCYITDRTQLPGDEATRRRGLLDKIVEAVRCGIDYIQLREKDLSTRELEQLASEVVNAIRQHPLATRNSVLTTGSPKPETRLLINFRTDVAISVGADGVHLRSSDVSPAVARRVWSLVSTRNPKLATRNFTIGVSCHSVPEVALAAAQGADFAVFAPVFEKKNSPQTHPAGLEALRQGCQHKIPVLALGGVTLENARACLEVGAAGIAAIRLFQENDIHQVVNALRSL